MKNSYVFLENKSRDLFNRISDRIDRSKTLSSKINVYYTGTNLFGDIKIEILSSMYLTDMLKVINEELEK